LAEISAGMSATSRRVLPPTANGSSVACFCQPNTVRRLGPPTRTPLRRIEPTSDCFACTPGGVPAPYEVELVIDGYSVFLGEEDVTGSISMGFDFALFIDEVPPAFADV
jgi:hypothetical protein